MITVVRLQNDRYYVLDERHALAIPCTLKETISYLLEAGAGSKTAEELLLALQCQVVDTAYAPVQGL